MHRRMKSAIRMETLLGWFLRTAILVTIILLIKKVVFIAIFFGVIIYAIYKLRGHYSDKVRYYSAFNNSASYVDVATKSFQKYK